MDKSIDISVVTSGISEQWLQILKPGLESVLSKVDKPFTPPEEYILEFARLTDYDNIKICIIGQDPYPKAGDAHGLAFSCLTGIPVSLRNIYKCLFKSGLIKAIPDSGNLEYWAKQGVLLINTALTTRIGVPNYHTDIWSDYMISVIKKISKEKNIIFFLWGANAKELRQYINKTRTVMEWVHPASRSIATDSFVDCPHFADANKMLISSGQDPIDWNICPLPSKIERELGYKPGMQVVFTDGSCYPNKAGPTSRAGYAIAFALGSLKDTIIYGSLDTSKEFATNQRAEGMAILKTLEFLNSRLDSWTTLVIISDSDFWIKMFLVYMKAWAKKDGFQEKKNPDLTIPMWNLYYMLTNELEKEIIFRHMKSHNKDGWGSYAEDSFEKFCYINNEYVDQLAEYARTELQPGECKESIAAYEEESKSETKSSSKITKKKDETEFVDDAEAAENAEAEFESTRVMRRKK